MKWGTTLSLLPELVRAAIRRAGTPLRVNWRRGWIYRRFLKGQLADHIEQTHHAYLHTELPRLSTLVAKVVDVHGARHPELAGVAATYEDLRADLEPHLLKEERMLFPMIRELAASAERPQFHCGSLQNPIAVMLAEHDRAGELFTQLRAQTDEYRAPDDGCASYRMLFAGLAEVEADTHLHIHKENNVLFPAVLRLESDRSGEVAAGAAQDDL